MKPGDSADLGGGARAWPPPLAGQEDQDGAPGLLVPQTRSPAAGASARLRYSWEGGP